MENSGVRRVRCTAWGERVSGQGVQAQAAAQTDSGMNWGSALVEDLLGTSVIPDRNMAVLKELDVHGAGVDPVLLSDLRHDKEMRAAVHSSRARPPHADIMMEAKRILRREEKAKKLSSIQNRIVDEEVDRFQNHIRSLRKMNQRLERIAFPTVQKRPIKISPTQHLSSQYLSKGVSADKIPEDRVPCLGPDKSQKKDQNMNGNVAERTDEAQQIGGLRRKSSLSISGNKMDDHEILQHRPVTFSQTSSESQNTVFERIHQKYMESERNRVLKEGPTLIRHPSPINELPGQSGQQAAVSSSTIPSILKDENKVQLGEWVEETTDDSYNLIQKSEVFLNEWSLPGKTSHEAVISKKMSEPARGGKVPSPSGTLPPAVVSRKGDQNKLENLSKMYAKWMTKVCVPSSTKSDECGAYKARTEKRKEGATKQSLNPISREEKIMQVLQALQKHKQTKPCGDEEATPASSSRFSKSVNDVREERAEGDHHRFRRAISGSYDHRLKAHKDLITHQKAKLEEQKKEIEDLKLSQLRMESEKSQMLTKKTLNEVLDNCSETVKAQAKSLKSSLSLVDLSSGNDFALRMEQRALEQKQRKLLAQERRKQMEDERKRKVKELEEKKRLEEEELARKKHEEAQEIRRKERELREEARKERERIIALERKADQFCEKRRLKNGFHGFKKLLSLRKMQEELATVFHNKLLLQKAFKLWRCEVEWILQAKMECADYFYSSNLLHRCFNALKSEAQERERCMQVAVDMHDFHLQGRYFQMWLKFTQKQQEIEAEKIEKADHHFSKVLLRKSLLMWQKYPQVAQLEREKERRKMIWRNKVQQVLPDFRPVLSSD